MNKKHIITIVLSLIILAGLISAPNYHRGLAQESSPEDAQGAEATLAGNIPIQGLLTNAAGNPLNGYHEVTFSLYEVVIGGSAVCSDTRTVSVSDGLFNTAIRGCANLGIQVEADPEMTPRQAIYAVPYALSLKPGAVIKTAGFPALHVETTSPSGRGLRAYALATSGTNYGVVGASTSPDGYGGYFYNNAGGIGLRSWSNSSAALDHPAILGCAANSEAVCGEYKDAGPAGVLGYGAFGVYGIGTSMGVFGQSSSSYGFGGYFNHTDGGVALVADSTAANDDDIVRIRNNFNTKFKVQGDGDVYIDGSYYNTGADFAELLPARDGLEPGDVLIVGVDGQLTRSTTPYQSAVVGIYSTSPGYVGGASEDGDATAKAPLAILGVVPVKATAENGAIRPGNLLVTSSTPGHAMRAGDNPPQGTILGKALGELEEGSGVILVLVTLQ